MSSEQGEGVPVPEGPKKKEGKPVAEMLMNGDFADMWTVVSGLVDDVPDFEVWQQLAMGEATLDDLTYSDERTRLEGEDIANAVRMVDAVAQARFPGYKEFTPQWAKPARDLQGETAKLGVMARKLVAFFDATNVIASCLNNPHSDTEYPSGKYKKE